MALISIKRNVDLQPGLNAPAVFNCSQGDKGTTMMIGLMNGGNDYTVPSGVTITIRGSRSNGAVFTPVSATSSGSTVSFTLTEEMTDTAGPTLCEAVLSQGNDVLGTANFIINVEGSPMGADVPPVFADAAWDWMLGKLTTETVPALGDDVISSIQGKVDKNQGSTNAKKFLRVNTSGNVSLASTDKTLSVADQIADAKETGDQIRALDAEIDGVATTLGGSISTLNGITTDLQSSKLNKNQGTSNVGKTMVVDSSGNIVPGDVPITIDDTLSIADAAADAKAAGDAIALKANASTIAPEFSDQNTYTAGSYVLKNGVLYRFTAAHTGAWTGTDAEVVTVGGEVTNLKAEISDQLTEITVSKGTLTPDEYVKFETGEFLPYGGWSRTGYLSCDKYTQIKLSVASQYSAFYDANHVYIKKGDFTGNTYVDVPDNAEYFVVSGVNSKMNNLTINAMLKGLGYILNESVGDINEIVRTDKVLSSSQLLDSYLISGTGYQLASSDWVCTNPIMMEFDNKSGYDVRGTFYGVGGTAFYDADNQFLLAINGNNVFDYGGASTSNLQTIHVPPVQGAKYVRISGYKSKTASASDLWIKGNAFNGTYEHIADIESKIKTIEANVSTTISQSKVLVMGDSISTDSYGNYKKWVTRLIESGFLPSDTTNSSRHATGFVARYNNEANDFITRIKAIENPSQYDLVVIFGGINDYIQNVPMGEETGTDYTVSFKPAVNEFFNYLMQNFTQARLCVLLPLRTYATWTNSVGEYQQAYGDYIKQVAKSYCLPVLNLTEDSGFCPYISTFSDMWTLQPEGYQSHDGVHPNEEYEQRFLAPMIKHFLQGLL